MAIAKRVRQDNKVVQQGFKTQHLALVVQIEEDGKVAERETLESGYERIPNMVSVPTPDRVLLDLSMDEAEAVRLVIYSIIGGSHPIREPLTAVERALYNAGVATAAYESLGIAYNTGQNLVPAPKRIGAVPVAATVSVGKQTGASAGQAASSKQAISSPSQRTATEYMRMQQMAALDAKKRDAVNYALYGGW